jgi:hypothetical protein
MKIYLWCCRFSAFLIYFMALNAFATTFYIDWNTGSDANAGLSASSPWRRHPYMQGFLGSYNHSVGDRFIFKGGVTWPNSCFQMNLTAGGLQSSPDYYGATNIWYTGASFSRPKFDFIETTSTTARINLSSLSFVTFDNLEFSGLIVSDGNAWPPIAYVLVYGGSNVKISNCYAHKWRLGNTADENDAVFYMLQHADGVIENCIIDGSESLVLGKGSMRGVWGATTVRSNIVKYVSNGVGVRGDAYNNNIGPIVQSINPQMHGNALYVFASGKIYNNVIHDVWGVGGGGYPVIYVEVAYNNNCNTNYVFNNVVFNTVMPCISLEYEFTSSQLATRTYIYNNTLVGGTENIGIYAVDRPYRPMYVDFWNNLFIGNTVPMADISRILIPTSGSNLTLTVAQATAAGYTLENQFRPTSGNSPTVDAGVQIPSILATDHLGVGRPQGAAWDIGAYEYRAVGSLTNPIISASPLSLLFGAVSVNTIKTNIVTVQNIGGGTLAGVATLQGSEFSVVSGGTYTLGENQSQPVAVRFAPTAMGTNTQTITFTGGGGATVTVSGVAALVNNAPVANDDAYNMVQGSSLAVTSSGGVLNNDEGTNLTALLVSGPTNGTFSLGIDGGFVYTPMTNFSGMDTFMYRASNGQTNSGTAMVNITVNASGGIFSDDFSRSTLSPWISVMGSWSLTNGVLFGNAAAGNYGYVCLSSNWTDYSFECRIQLAADAYACGVGGRVDLIKGSHYGVWVYPGGGSGFMRLLKFSDWTSWSGTPMQQVSVSSVSTNWHTLKLVFQGPRIQVYYDGTSVLDVTDNGFDGSAAYLSGGISADLGQSSMRVDNVLVTSLIMPSISVSPTSQSFGTMMAGTTIDRTFSVQNVGGGILSGSASVAAPFSIVSGSPYSLGAGQSQALTVRYSPTLTGTNTQSIALSGGGGATAIVNGSSWLPPSVSAIVQSGTDVNLTKTGLQVFAGSVVQYSGSATDPNGYLLSWQWIYSTNGNEIVAKSGTGSVDSLSYNYTPDSVGSTFNWKLRVSNGYIIVETNLIIGVDAPPAQVDGLTFLAGAGDIIAPFVYTNGYISQPLQTIDPATGGRAAYAFTITYSGDYVIQGLVNAPNDSANSFYLNIDAEPENPGMIWDIPATSTFEQRVVSWRGNGSDVNNQYVPKVFSLNPGLHQVIIRGREANVQLNNLRILQLPPPPRNLRVMPQP